MQITTQFAKPTALPTAALLLTALVVTPIPANGEAPHVCEGTYALCIAASCVDNGDGTATCGDCDSNDGSCGYCYVFEGQSSSYEGPCQPASGDTVFSTYSPILSQDFGFEVLTCPNTKTTAGCMDAQCTLTGERTVLGHLDGYEVDVPTAICQCKLSTLENGTDASTLGGACSSLNCSAIWSTAYDTPCGVLRDQPQCSTEGN